MKKVIGWILVICGILSLPGFFAKLANAQYWYEFFGMLVGQGMIFFLAYLCLRSKSKNSGDNNDTSKEVQTDSSIQPQQVISAEVEDKKYELEGQTLNAEVSNIETENIFKETNTVSLQQSFCKEKLHENSSMNINEQVKEDEVAQVNDSIATDFPDFAIENVTWKKIYALIFNFQKKELLKKCDPSNFMVPYNHDKLAIANEIIILINKSVFYQI